MSALSRRPDPHSFFAVDAAADIVRRVRDAGGEAADIHRLLEEIVFTVLCETGGGDAVLDALADAIAERLRLLGHWLAQEGASA